MSLATYTFASLLHRGFTADATASATVTVQVSGEESIVQPVSLMTPADVLGIPPRQVIRTWPLAGVRNAEPNYLVLVEFDAPDLPWLVSRPDSGGVTRPWLMLVVISEQGLGEDPLTHSASGTRLTVDVAQLPDPKEAWLWAHAQLLGTDTVPGDPSRSLSRLLCPRRLEPDTPYLACVVPVFDVGAKAGLGEPAATLEPIRTSAEFAWDPGAGGTVELPVYHWFRFATGQSGDFESLVRRLHGVPLPDALGRRHLRLDHPRSGMPRSLAGDLDLDVALRRPGAKTEPIRTLARPDNALGGYLDTLLARLTDAGYDVSLVASGVPPRVGPPVYGQLPVGQVARAANVDTDEVPPWLRQVNVDPRLRVAAGLGAEVVRRNQDHYVEQAWRQVGDVLAANRLRRRAEYSLAASRRLYARWIEQLDTGDLLSSTSPVHAKIAVGPGETIVGRLRDSPVPPVAVSVELRRFSRARGTLAHAAAWQAGLDAQTVVRRSGEREPFVSRVPLDSVEALELPSTIWGIEAAKGILSTLVQGAGVEGLSPAEAAGRLDRVSRVSSFGLPEVDAVAAHLDAEPVDVDTALGTAGLVPTRLVIDAVTAQPAEPPPGGAGGGGHGHGHGHGHGPLGPFHPGDPAGPVIGPAEHGPAEHGPAEHGPAVGPFEPGHVVGPFHPPPPAAGPFEPVASGPVRQRRRGIADLVLVHPGGTSIDLTGAIRPTTVLATVKVNPTLVTRVGDSVVIDAIALEDAARTGTAATKITGRMLDDALAGTFEPAAPVDLAFELPAERVGPVRDEIARAVLDLAGLVIRPPDAADRPGRILADGLESLRQPVLDALDPRTTLVRAVNSRISELLAGEAEVFDDIMAAPDLSEPTYGQLAAISNDWLLPGIDALPADTTTLVAANLDFIEAFLVGMNHELARELLWREYPTDQRGTYARQFWTHVATAVRADQFDLKSELHRSPLRHLAGLSRPEGAAAAGTPIEDPLVLVVKGELVQRYPGVIVCAARTEDAGGLRVPRADSILMPDFVGRLEPDVMLVGFTTLTEQTVRDAAADPGDAWWFFFAEHFTEPRFGLDELDGDPAPMTPVPFQGASWNDAAWQHAALRDRTFLTAASFTAGLPKRPGTAPAFRWGHDAAAQAWITLQFPFRRGMPALDLLPPETTTGGGP